MFSKNNTIGQCRLGYSIQHESVTTQQTTFFLVQRKIRKLPLLGKNIFYIRKQRIYALATDFINRPNRKWTFISPDDTTKNENDYFLTTNKRIFENVIVISKCTTRSDHGIVISKVNINGKTETLFEKKKRMNTKTLRLHGNNSGQLSKKT